MLFVTVWLLVIKFSSRSHRYKIGVNHNSPMTHCKRIETYYTNPQQNPPRTRRTPTPQHTTEPTVHPPHNPQQNPPRARRTPTP